MLEQSSVVKLRALASASRAKFCKGHKAVICPKPFKRKHNFARLLLLGFETYNMDFEDEDGPPLLVEVEATGNDNTEESKPIKVPITIVTGKSPCPC